MCTKFIVIILGIARIFYSADVSDRSFIFDLWRRIKGLIYQNKRQKNPDLLKTRACTGLDFAFAAKSSGRMLQSPRAQCGKVLEAHAACDRRTLLHATFGFEAKKRVFCTRRTLLFFTRRKKPPVDTATYALGSICSPAFPVSPPSGR
jgi:hypothetical protein